MAEISKATVKTGDDITRIIHDERPLQRRSSSESFHSVAEEAIGGHSAADLPKHYYRSFPFLATCLSFALSYQGSYLGYVMPANALTIINEDIGPSPDIIWVLLVFVLCQGVTFTIVGRLSDVFGRRWFYLFGNTLALVGFVVCGSAKKVTTIIGGSVLSGIGTAIQLSSVIVSGELVEKRRRFLLLGCIEFFFGPMAVIAPGLTRTLCTQATWRWVYYLPALFSGLALGLQIFFYHPPAFHQLHKNHSRRAVLKSLDYGGVIIFAGSAVSILLGISWGGQKYPWHSYQVITTIVVGGVGLIAFALYEKYSGVHYPLMPLRLFRNQNYVALSVVTSVGSMTFYGLSIVWPQEVAALFTTSQARIGWMSCTLTAGGITGQFIGGFAGFLPKVKWQLVTVCCLFTAFTGAMAAVEPGKEAMAVVFSVISSTMIGIMETVTFVAGPLMVEEKDIGLANGVQFAIRSGASTLADSIFVTILSNKLATNLPKYIVPKVVEAGLPLGSVPALLNAISSGSAAAVEAVPGITPKIILIATAAAKVAYQKSFQVIYLAAVAFGACAIIGSLTVSEAKLEECMTSDVARKLQGVEHKPVLTEEKTARSV